MIRQPLIVTICSTKGGTGKTTLTANLGGLLADHGKKVLLVDADIQPTLSSYYAFDKMADAGIRGLIKHGRTDTISSTTVGCDIVYSDDPDGKLQSWIRDTPDGRIRLRHILRTQTKYDVILIDTQGAVGPLQDVGVAAADWLLSPIPPEILSAREFVRGTMRMLDRMQLMQNMGAPIGPLHGVIYRLDRTIDASRIMAELRRESYVPSRGGIRILETAIPSMVAYREAATARTPVHRWETHRAGPTPSARETMLRLATELFPDLNLDDPKPALNAAGAHG